MTDLSRRTLLGGLGGALAAPALLTADRAEGAGPAARIRLTRATGFAPLGVFFQAEATGFAAARPLHDLRYLWEFDDAGTWRAPGPAHPSDLARATAYGPWAVHCFTETRPHRVRLTVTDGSRIATDARDIRPVPPLEAFRGDAVAVSPGGDFEGAPRGARRFTDLAQAVAHAGGGGLILLRRGERFPAQPLFRLGRASLVTGFGPGPRPVIEGGTVALSRVEAPSGFLGLDFRGPYDPRTGRGAQPIGLYLEACSGPVSVHDCRFRGHGIGLRVTGAPQVVTTDTVIADFADYGVLHPDAELSGLRGCRVTHDPSAGSGSDGQKGRGGVDRPDQGPVRLPRAMKRYVVDQCRFFSNAGWSGQFGAGPGSAHQPCLRWNSNGGAGAQGIVARSVMEGGMYVFLAASNVGASRQSPVDLILEKNYLLASANTRFLAVLGFGGTTVRNNVFLYPDTLPEHAPHRARPPIAWQVRNPRAGNTAVPVRVLNNAFVDMRTHPRAATDPDAAGAGGAIFTDFAAAGNLVHAPGLAAPAAPWAPLAESPALFRPLYAGRRRDGAVDAAHATPEDAPASFRPRPGSPAIGAAGDAAPLDDFDGRLRRGPTAVGPYHGPSGG